MQSVSRLDSHHTIHRCLQNHKKFLTFHFESSLRWLNFHPQPKYATFSGSFNASCRFKLRDRDGNDCRNPVPLPIVVQKFGRASQYCWDGDNLRLVDLDREVIDWFSFGDWLYQLFESMRKAVRDLFVPRKVQDNYMGYLKWKLVHRIFSSALQVLATQAMFRAIGIGSSHGLPSAAALNWVLKEGLGRLSRCIYTASLGSSFDANLKRVRFSTSVLFSLSIGVELLTPAIPEYFLLLATLANIAKSISLAAYLATGPAIHRSFAIADNLGEISAKSQIQTVCFDNLGLLLAALLNEICKANKRFQAGIPYVVYPIFAVGDLFAIYKGLEFVHLQTLTKDRLECIINMWVHSEFVPSPAEVSSKEGIDIFMKKGSKSWPIRIGCPDPEASSSIISVVTMQSLADKDRYFICMETSHKGSIEEKQGILLALRELSDPSDIIMGLLQACLIRKKLLMRQSNPDFLSRGECIKGSIFSEWFEAVADSRSMVDKEVKRFIDGLHSAGWSVKSILLDAQEQVRYKMIGDVS